ncbi:DUF3060 domain-containing protein [Tahibacter caeni]|uniref:DUF3060 domain-containing protein n=1 Tax=Tahibacter caeni TaxID=1453545 RepID=UPI00214746EE|nr:DUF3060 domain-containing protein [Tahibacter caeni]
MSLLLRTSLLLVLGVLPFAVPAAKNDQSVAADPGHAMTVSQEGSDVVHFCAELEDVSFIGSNNRIEANGPCRSVSIVGSSNAAILSIPPEKISVNGNDNRINWIAADRAKPIASVNGRGNVVEVQKDQ